MNPTSYPRQPSSIFPVLGTYRFGKRVERVIVLGVGRHDELRLVGQDGHVRSEPAFRVQLDVRPEEAAA